MLVHTALNKTKREAQDPYYTHQKYVSGCRAGFGAAIGQSFTLLSHNVVYAIRCKRCNTIYVGETGATIKQRLYQHIYHIKKGISKKLLYIHFTQHLISNLSLFGLETNTNWSLGQRRGSGLPGSPLRPLWA
ncbi:unnamed protein product [Lota lota]